MLNWKPSSSLDPEFGLEGLEMPLGGGRNPNIFHFDQRCQLTSTDFVERLHTKKFGSAGQDESAAKTTSLSNACCGQLSKGNCMQQAFDKDVVLAAPVAGN